MTQANKSQNILLCLTHSPYHIIWQGEEKMKAQRHKWKISCHLQLWFPGFFLTCGKALMCYTNSLCLFFFLSGLFPLKKKKSNKQTNKKINFKKFFYFKSENMLVTSNIKILQKQPSHIQSHTYKDRQDFIYQWVYILLPVCSP